mgnify:CR=1 FL=1
MKYHIDAESFGSCLPDCWQQIAAELNATIDQLGIADDFEAVRNLWDEYWQGNMQLIQYSDEM